MFTVQHLIWIALCAGAIALMCAIACKKHISFRTASLIMLCIAVASESSKIVSNMQYVNGRDATEGMVLAPGTLPFHLCSLMIFIFIVLPFCKNERIKNRLVSFFVPVGLLGAVLAILIPTSGTDFASIEAYQCFVYHSGMVWFALYLVLSKQVDLGVGAWLKNLATLFGLAIGMIWGNSMLQAYHTNFFFVVRPPMPGLPLLNLKHGWFVYFGTLVLCGVVGVTVIHMTYLLLTRNRNRNSEKETEESLPV